MQSPFSISYIMDQMMEIVREIQDLKDEISSGEKAWEEGSDPFEMAGCDPSDQFVKGEQISELRSKLFELADELDVALGRNKE
jgi:hypothetical protein